MEQQITILYSEIQCNSCAAQAKMLAHHRLTQEIYQKWIDLFFQFNVPAESNIFIPQPAPQPVQLTDNDIYTFTYGTQCNKLFIQLAVKYANWISNSDIQFSLTDGKTKQVASVNNILSGSVADDCDPEYAYYSLTLFKAFYNKVHELPVPTGALKFSKAYVQDFDNTILRRTIVFEMEHVDGSISYWDLSGSIPPNILADK